MEAAASEPEILVSVIMGVYNQWDQAALNLAVDSILRQTLSDLELIIYDDGSAPDAAQYIRQLQGRDDRIRLYGADENHGLAFSLNECVKLARGKYVARMDADDVSDPERLRSEYDFLEANPQYSWCGTNAYLFNDSGVWGEREMPEIPQETDYLRFSPYIHPSVMYRREVIAVHTYEISEDTLRCEDYEIFMRLRQNGFCGYNIQKPLFYYREDDNSYQRRSFRFRINEMRIRYRNFKKLHLLFPFGWAFVLRPIIGGMVPRRMVAWLKRKESGYSNETISERPGETAPVIPGSAEKDAASVSVAE